MSQGTGAAQQQPSPEQQKEMADQAAAPLLENLRSNPNDFSALAMLGNIYYDAQQFPQAIQYYERALKVNPDNADVRSDLGTALWYSGDADKAIAEFQKSLKLKARPDMLKPCSTWAWFAGKARWIPRGRSRPGRSC